MTSAAYFFRSFSIWAGVTLAAIITGYLLATPDNLSGMGAILAIFGAMMLPLAFRYHHPLLIATWNVMVVFTLLPGQPRLAMVLTAVSLVCSVLAYTLDRKSGLQNDPSLTLPLVALLAVVAVTTRLRGGIGLQSLGGSSSGGKEVVLLMFSIATYFAFSWRRLAAHLRSLVVSSYFLGGVVGVVPNLAYLGGSSFYWLFIFFPVEAAIYQAAPELRGTGIVRLAGLGVTANAISYFMIARYGLRGILDFHRPWRITVFVISVLVSLTGGFRGILILILMVTSIQFFLEGLHRTRWLAIFGATGVLGLMFLALFGAALPNSIQRTVSFLPFVRIDSVARLDAESSSRWRLEMWDIVWPDVPKYLWLGKGYAIDQTLLYMTQHAQERGLAADFESALVTGNYHSGPLSLIIPLGIWGVLTFLAFSAAAIRLLFWHYRHGEPEMRGYNTFLLSYFLASWIHFWTVFGGFATGLGVFTSLAGLSMALNGPVRRRTQLPWQSEAAEAVASGSAKMEVATPPNQQVLRR